MIFGHKKNLKIFSRYIEVDKFPHGVLFSGTDKIGKRTIALEIAKYLQGNHKEKFYDFSQKECFCQTCNLIREKKFAGVTEIKKEEAQISIQKLREIRKNLFLSSPYPYKIVIIDNAEALSREATGALLKILEEPRGKTIFFLLTQRPNILLKTILSRIEVFKFLPMPRGEIIAFLESIEVPKQESSYVAQVIDFSIGKPGLAKELILDKNKIIYYNKILETIRSLKKYSILEKFLLAEKLEKEGKTEDFLFLAGLWFQDIISSKNNFSFFVFDSKKEEAKKDCENFSEKDLKEITKKIEKTKNYLLFSNVSRILAIENLLLQFR